MNYKLHYISRFRDAIRKHIRKKFIHIDCAEEGINYLTKIYIDLFADILEYFDVLSETEGRKLAANIPDYIKYILTEYLPTSSLAILSKTTVGNSEDLHHKLNDVCDKIERLSVTRDCLRKEIAVERQRLVERINARKLMAEKQIEKKEEVK